MKKINIVVLLLLGSSGVAQAEWESVSMSADATFAEYINRASTRKTPQGYKVWELLDFKTLQQGVVVVSDQSSCWRSMTAPGGGEGHCPLCGIRVRWGLVLFLTTVA